jgi:hypothetical protein
MKAEELEAHFQARLEHIAYISERTGMYKVCDQCRSLVLRSHPACPFCAAYRFSEDVEYIHATLKEAALVPMPLNSPVVPRIKPQRQAERWLTYTPRVSFHEP